jgi:hypothetical protein
LWQAIKEKLLREETTARTLSYVEIDFLTREAFASIQRDLSFEENRSLRINISLFALMRGVQYIHKSGGYFPSMRKYEGANAEPTTPKAFGVVPRSRANTGGSDTLECRDDGPLMASMERMERRLKAHIDEKIAATHAEIQNVQANTNRMMNILSNSTSAPPFMIVGTEGGRYSPTERAGESVA